MRLRIPCPIRIVPGSMAPAELRRIRQSLGLTQEELARALGVTPNTVARWEQGVHAVSPLARLALLHLARTHGPGHAKSRKASA